MVQKASLLRLRYGQVECIWVGIHTINIVYHQVTMLSSVNPGRESISSIKEKREIRGHKETLIGTDQILGCKC